MNKKINIAIDGPVSSGKSTISKILAKETGTKFISTGSIYRAIAFEAQKNNVDLKNTNALLELIESLDITFNDESNIVVNGDELTSQIRAEEVSVASAIVASITEVRIKLVDLQQQIAKSGGVLMEGRDIGTVILPNADLKIFLTCDAKVRAQRRFADNKNRGIETSLEEIIENIQTRDHLDMTRKQSPLKKADDAIEISSTQMTIREVVDAIKELIK